MLHRVCKERQDRKANTGQSAISTVPYQLEHIPGVPIILWSLECRVAGANGFGHIADGPILVADVKNSMFDAADKESLLYAVNGVSVCKEWESINVDLFNRVVVLFLPYAAWCLVEACSFSSILEQKPVKCPVQSRLSVS